jgi:hypothetical protein
MINPYFYRIIMNDRAASRARSKIATPSPQPTPLIIQNRAVILREGNHPRTAQQAPLSTSDSYGESGIKHGIYLDIPLPSLLYLPNFLSENGRMKGGFSQ